MSYEIFCSSHSTAVIHYSEPPEDHRTQGVAGLGHAHS